MKRHASSPRGSRHGRADRRSPVAEWRLFPNPLLLGGQPDIRIHLSVPLVLEYGSVAKREAGALGLTGSDVEDVVDFLCKIGAHHDLFYLWRPVLRDPKDDMILELAVAASCQAVLTYNKRDFQGVERFGLEVETPYEFLKRIGEVK